MGDPQVIGQRPIMFTDVTAQVGIPAGVSAGLAFVDFDDDGWPDLIGNGEKGFVIYRNVGGTFEDSTPEVMGELTPEQREAGSAVLGDVDGDGDLDMLTGNRRALDVLWLNDGRGHFRPASNNGGIPLVTDTTIGNFTDIDRDGDLDLYLSRGRRWNADRGLTEEQDGFAGTPNLLLENTGSGQYIDVTTAWSAAAGDTSETFQAIFADFDRDGDDDALVVRDFLPDHLLINEAGERFDDTSSGITSSPTTLMGCSIGDLNGDGHLDLYCTNGPQDYVYQGRGDGRFDNTFQSMLVGGDPTVTTSGWGVVVGDIDNDGDQDVVAISADDESGHVSQSIVSPGAWIVLENRDGALVDITDDAGLGRVSGYALAAADFDLDGDLDIAIAASQPKVAPDAVVGTRILRNDSARAAGNRFLELNLRADSGNRFAVGAIIDVRAAGKRASRVVTAGESFQSAHSLVQHFGLGAATAAERVEITWPNGAKQRIQDLPSGYHRLKPYSGDCCGSESCADPALPRCPTWDPISDPCNGAPECSLCELACARLDECGLLDSDCLGECSADDIHPLEVSCLLDAPCLSADACLGDRGPERD